MVEKISRFVEEIRLDNDKNSGHDIITGSRNSSRGRHTHWTPPSNKQRKRSRCHSRGRSQTPKRGKKDENTRGKDVADDMIIQAKQFRAQVTAPKGNEINVQNKYVLPPEIELLRQNDNDDDFFHITCHVDPGLKSKIERGEFVELDKLFSKEGAMLNDAKKIELVNRGGTTFFAPVQDKDTKISSIQKWEQASGSMLQFLVRYVTGLGWQKSGQEILSGINNQV